jgi:hypothetical protein
MIRSTAFGTVLLLVSCAMVFAQDFQPATTSNAKQFVGTWQASFNGSPFLTIIFAMADNKVTGSSSHANIDINPAGELTKAEAGDEKTQSPMLRLRATCCGSLPKALTDRKTLCKPN